MKFTRRQWLKISAGAAVYAGLPAALSRPGLVGSSGAAGSSVGRDFSRVKLGDVQSAPHFFLMVVLNGGADSSYMFDARPLSMTAAGKIQNYLGEEPVLYEDPRGGKCLRTSLVTPLMPFMQDLSVLNGVVMTPTFDGHLQNMNFLFTGNSFGGESFIPDLNGVRGSQKLPLDAIIPSKTVFTNSTNHSSVVPIGPAAIGGLSKSLTEVGPADPSSGVHRFIQSRYANLARGMGRFAAANSLMAQGHIGSVDLHSQLGQLKRPNPEKSDVEQEIDLVIQAFKNRIAESGLIKLSEEFDTHAPVQAKSQPQLFRSSMDKLAKILSALKTSAWDEKRSMLDVTTVLIGTEMGRTFRTIGLPIDDTGTNHNQFSNSFLIGGKGIRGGLVLGASDFDSAEAKLSEAHLALDPQLEKAIGRPYDFAADRARTDLPKVFELKDHLTVNSVINTIYQNFGVGQAKHRTLGRDLPVAPVIRSLLV